MAHPDRQLAVDSTLPPAKLIADATSRSAQAHLFHFYTPLYEIATVARNPPSAWIIPGSPPTPPPVGNGHGRDRSKRGKAAGASSSIETAVEIDSRQLAKECLRQLGKEIGAEV
jgi:hypothetical protein